MNNKQIIENFRLELVAKGMIDKDEKLLTKSQILLSGAGIAIDPSWKYYECQIWIQRKDGKTFYKKKVKLYPSKQILAL